MYQITYRNCENGISLNGWTATINSLLLSLGLNVVWYAQGVVNMTLFEHVLKQRLQDNHIIEWNRVVSNSNDGILYRTYKLKPFYSQFINSITKPCYRYSFLKVVTKNHNILVVRGKWFQPKPYNERLCSTCEVLGDECHFLLQCTKHEDLRLKLIARYYWERPSMHKIC